MAFYEHIREYREQLDITQMEAAKRLDIDHSVLSKYERGDLAIPINLLKKFREVYGIPRDEFLDMLEDKRLKRKDPGLEARESRTRYIETFQEEIISQLIDLKEFRQLMMDIISISPNNKERRQYIREITKKD